MAEEGEAGLEVGCGGGEWGCGHCCCCGSGRKRESQCGEDGPLGRGQYTFTAHTNRHLSLSFSLSLHDMAPISPPSSSSKTVLLSLYRSLLRSSSPFSPPSPSHSVYASLLHRSGISHDWEEFVYHKGSERRPPHLSLRDKHCLERLPKEWAQNLTRSYTDLQEEYALRKESFHARYGRHDDDEEEEDDVEDEETFIDRAMGSSHYRTSMRERQLIEYLSEEDPKVVLFRHLLREWFAGGETMEDATTTTTTTNDGCKESATRKWSMDEEGFIENGKVRQVPLMRFPSQIIDGGGLSLRQLIQREFRAPTAEQRLAEEALTLETTRGKSTPHNNKKPLYPPSSYVDNHSRMQTAFYTLMELNRKLAWAEKIGFPPPTRQQQLLKNESLMKELEQRRNWKRLVQAASGVSRFPHKTIDARGESNSLRMEEAIVASDTKASPEINTNPLQCGSFLIAHPLMTGYFAKSVILLLDHTEASSKSTSSTENQAESEEVGSGGTYGLIINRLALQPVSSEKRLDIIRQRLEEKKLQQQSERNADGATPTTSKSKSEDATSVNLMRPITLLQAINASDLPEAVQEAFGDVPVREGGPVNLSLQMIHRKCLDVTKSRDIGRKKQVEDVTFTSEEVEVEEATTETVGGTLIPSLLDDEDGIETEAFYFGGDVIRASLDVSEGIEDQGMSYSYILFSNLKLVLSRW